MFAHVRYLSVNSFNGYELKSGFLANCRNFAARVRLPSFLSYMGNISIFSADITAVVCNNVTIALVLQYTLPESMSSWL